MRTIGSKVDTLVGFAIQRRIEPPVTLLTQARPLGPSPFGPATAEFDLTPFMRRLPIEVPRRLLLVAVLICFVAGSALALATATDGPPMTLLKWSTTTSTADSGPGPGSLAQAALER